MPLYDYRCPEGDIFEAFFSMHDKPDTATCPSCGQSASSLMPAIGPSKLNSAQMRLLDATRATAETPEVVHSISGARSKKRPSTPVTRNPLHQKLPRP
ncbi:FmdB family zinc ribbon protein [Enteractinococcus coprophilus]|uniref:Putative FmdB family regulatory protein n=1 Tax=Enteractinococcus coprophilus TaxID=1027633 RepID=A0A543AM28_9MICC|nr:zinc ribbon domain-containing protein [Enteractinococcus coprophilus]TQL73599.1 putative FmdB family regulatory protein [Enteractinococcus coprophilus]